MNDYLLMGIKIITALVVLFFITRIMLGKTQLSQITPFDFVSALVLGELVGEAIYSKEISILKLIFTPVLWGILIYIIEMISQKYKGTRKFLEDEPNIVIQKGQIKYDALKVAKTDINQLQGLIRQQGYFSLREVEYAILETNGMVSVLPKSPDDTPKRSDLNLPNQNVTLPINLINDGEVIYDNLQEFELEETWLKEQLAMNGISDYKEVLHAEWKENEPLYIVKYE